MKHLGTGYRYRIYFVRNKLVFLYMITGPVLLLRALREAVDLPVRPEFHARLPAPALGVQRARERTGGQGFFIFKS